MDDKGRTHDLAELAARQFGVVSTADLEALGYSRHALSRAAGTGQLHRLHQGVYAVGHSHLTWEGHCLAAVLACRPDAMASHASAGWIWGLLGTRPQTIDVTALTRRHRRRGMRLHFGSLLEEDRTVHEGIPVTAVPRTLLDLAARLGSRGLDRVLERADKHGLVDLVAVHSLLERCRGHHGVRRLRRALALYREEPAVTHSHIERRFLRLVRQAGLPAPSMNCWVGRYSLDAYWEPERFAVELDTFETHGSRLAFQEDRLRDDYLHSIDVEVVRVTDTRLDREPHEVMNGLAAHLARRRRALRAAA